MRFGCRCVLILWLAGGWLSLTMSDAAEAGSHCRATDHTPRHSSAGMFQLLTPPKRVAPWTGNAAVLIPGAWANELFLHRLPEVAACFAEGTSPEMVAWYDQLLAGDAGPLAYFLANRWPGSQGDPFALTWSFMPDGVDIPPGVGEPLAASNLFATMDLQFGGNRALWISLFEQSFARWSELTGLTYIRVTDGVNDWDDGAAWGNGAGPNRGDVRIGMKFIDGGSGSNVLAYNYFPGSGGDMVFDSSNIWTSTADNFRFLRNVIMHEHGHGLGMFHVCPAPTGGFGDPPGVRTKLMEPFLATNFDGPQHDDIRAGHRHYGGAYEENNSAGTAGALGALTHGVPLLVGSAPNGFVNHGATLSLDADGEVDFFTFDVSAASSLLVTVTPRGLNYDSSPQVSGNCTSGNFVNSLAMANLDVEVLAPDGTTVLAMGASQPAGTAETVFLPQIAAGSYYVRIFESNAPLESQLYQMTLAAAPPTPNPVAGEPDPIAKNRYISFSPDNPGTVMALRVDKMTAPSGSCFVSAPDAQGNSRCTAAATFRIWSEAVVHVGDCEIIPVATYGVRSTLDGNTFSPSLSVSTIATPVGNSKLWGDVAGPFGGAEWGLPDTFANVTDILAVLDRLNGITSNPVSFQRANMQSVSANDPCLNAFVNTADLFITVRAVAGDAYPFLVDGALCPECP